jgi:hypothetical protein
VFEHLLVVGVSRVHNSMKLGREIGTACFGGLSGGTNEDRRASTVAGTP